MFEYERGVSKITIGGFVVVYPLPGVLMVTLIMLPPLIVAVPIFWIEGVPVF